MQQEQKICIARLAVWSRKITNIFAKTASKLPFVDDRNWIEDVNVYKILISYQVIIYLD